MPADDTLELRISFRKLLIGLFLTVIPISLAGLYSITQSDKALETNIGGHFKTISETSASEIAQYVHDRVVSVGVLAAAPVLTEAAASSNRSYQGMSNDAITAKIQKIDNDWNTPAAEPVVKTMLSSQASRWLRAAHDRDPRLLRLTATDQYGATIAASHKTLDYFQADEEYWQNIYAEGRGSISVTDILYDDVTKSNYIGVGVPIVEDGTNRFIGTLDALVDVSTLFPIVNRAQIGPAGRTILVKEDGTIINAPGASLAMNKKAEEFTAAQDAAKTAAAGYLVTNIPQGPRTLIGFADTGLKRDYRKLSWYVLVCQDAHEALAPVRTSTRLIAFVSLLGLAMVTMLAAYFALHRKREFDEIGELREPQATRAARPGI